MKVLLDDTELVERLRAGDERTFLELVRSLHGQMAAFARTFVRSEAAAEDVVQDTWAAVVRGIGRFEGRSTLMPPEESRKAIRPGRRATPLARR